MHTAVVQLKAIQALLKIQMYYYSLHSSSSVHIFLPLLNKDDVWKIIFKEESVT